MSLILRGVVNTLSFKYGTKKSKNHFLTLKIMEMDKLLGNIAFYSPFCKVS